jgi:predicted outer membrane protein
MKPFPISTVLGWCIAVVAPCAISQPDLAANTPQQPRTTQETPAAQAPSAAATPGQTNAAAAQFARYAMFVGLVEIQLGQLALDLAVDELVRNFARQLIRDHTALNDRLSGLGRERGLNLPTADAFNEALRARLEREPEALANAQAQKPLKNTNATPRDSQPESRGAGGVPPEVLEPIMRLREHAAATFEYEFLNHLLSTHRESMPRFETASRDQPDPALRRHAEDALAILEAHHARASTLASRVRGLNVPRAERPPNR